MPSGQDETAHKVMNMVTGIAKISRTSHGWQEKNTETISNDPSKSTATNIPSR